MAFPTAALHLLSLLVLVLLLSPAVAQPPRGNGRGAAILRARSRLGPIQARLPLKPPLASAFSSDDGRGGRGVRPRLPPTLPSRPSFPSRCILNSRTLTGSCTSRLDSSWGESGRPQFSYFSSADSSKPSGDSLRSAREISNILSSQKTSVPNSLGINELFVFFGQFIDHNLVATPTTSQSLPIDVPSNDPSLSQSKLDFHRSERAIDTDGTQRPVNSLSAILDLSAVYGVEVARNVALRVPGSCKLKVSNGNFMPFNEGRFFNAPSSSREFYLAGDHRANEHPMLTILHTVFLREHNSLCDALARDVRGLTPVQLYEAARKINIGQFQKIVYEEFYPTIIRRRLPKYSRYMPLVNPTVSDIFSTAAFRVGHTMVGNVVSRKGKGGVKLPDIGMSDMFFRKKNLIPGDMESFVRGAATTRAQQVDLLVVDSLRDFLFKKVGEEIGIDLVALNIQRGRDHALPTYNQIRERFKMPKRTTFAAISRDKTVQERLSAAYNGNVDLVEAWPGMMAEDHLRGSGVGETLERVWREEFIRLRDGDQFFYRSGISFSIAVRRLPYVRTLFDDRRSGSTFKELLLRNTDMTEGDLSGRNVFRV